MFSRVILSSSSPYEMMEGKKCDILDDAGVFKKELSRSEKGRGVQRRSDLMDG